MTGVCRLLVGLLAVTSVALAEPESPSKSTESESIRMSVTMLRAADAAFKVFCKEQPKADLDNFKVSVTDEGSHVRIVFYPRQNPSRSVHEGNQDMVVMDRPSHNQYGWVKTYDVSKDSYKIIYSEEGAR